MCIRDRANPKRKFSKSRTRKRRSQYKIKTVKGVTCPNCGSPMIYHQDVYKRQLVD